MVIQLTDKEGKQIKPLIDAMVDIDLNGNDKDFQLTIPARDFDTNITYGSRFFVAGTEVGGILGELTTDTSVDTISWRGYTWRGLMSRKIIEPPEGQDYYIVNGELNAILKDLIEPMFGGVFVVPEIDSGVRVSDYQFVRYVNLLDGLSDMLRTVNYRLDIKYNEGEPNASGYVEVRAAPIVDYSDEIELSQDSQLNFSMTNKQNGINHLIILGQGELKDRTVSHLYIQEDGKIGTTKYYAGIDELIEIYENTSDVEPDLINNAKKRLE